MQGLTVRETLLGSGSSDVEPRPAQLLWSLPVRESLICGNGRLFSIIRARADVVIAERIYQAQDLWKGEHHVHCNFDS